MELDFTFKSKSFPADSDDKCGVSSRRDKKLDTESLRDTECQSQ